MRIGIDIGGMTIKLGVVEESGQIIARKVICTESDVNTPEDIVRNIVYAITGLLKEIELEPEDCSGIGVACPGTCDMQSGYVVYSNNIGWKNVPLLPLMQEYINIPMSLANDADTAALAEVLCGAAKGKRNAVLLTLGTGVGGGVILDKKIFIGPLRGGCELGHMVIERGGRSCTCGRKGCFESYASASALMMAGRAAAKANPQSLLTIWSGGDADRVDGRMIFEAKKQGDKAARLVVEEYEEYLSIGIANLINIFRPELVILGGGVSAQKQVLTDAVKRKVEQMCFGGELGEVADIVTSELGNDAGIIGAAFLTL